MLRAQYLVFFFYAELIIVLLFTQPTAQHFKPQKQQIKTMQRSKSREMIHKFKNTQHLLPT